MDSRFKNLAMIIGAVVIILVIVFFVLPSISDSEAVSFEEGIIKLNAIVENNNVPIARFQEGEIFSLNNESEIENNFSEQKFLKLKNDLRHFRDSVPESNPKLITTANFYIELVELNEKKKAIYDKIVSINDETVNCDLLPELNELLSLEIEYETEAVEFSFETSDFIIENIELSGVEELQLSFNSDLLVNDVTIVQESVAVLEEFCE